MTGEKDKKFINNMADKVIKRQSDQIDALVLQRDALQQRCEELVAAARFGVRELSAYGQEAVDVVVRNLEKAIKQVQPCNTPTK
jgi:hypothetical protein